MATLPNLSTLNPSLIAMTLSFMTPAQIGTAVSTLSPATIKSFLGSVTPDMATSIASAVTPDVAKAISSAMTPATMKAIASHLPIETLTALTTGASADGMKAIASALPKETLTTLTSALTPETASAFASALSPAGASTVSYFMQYVTGLDLATFATSKVGVNIDLGEGKAFTLSGAVMGAFGHEINVLTGSNFADRLSGDATSETINAGAGNDTIGGSLGADKLDGGSGVDTVNYEKSAFAVNVDLALHKGMGGDADGDVYANIENVTGTAYNDVLNGDVGSNTINAGAGNDTLGGGAGNDNLNGGAGNDVLEGGTGADVLAGGEGKDTVSYAHSAAGVNVNLQLGFGLGGEAAGDKYVGIENAQGSDFNDVLVGDAGANVLSGGKGNDYINGGAGSDTVNGGDGIDTVNYATSRAGVNLFMDGYSTGGDADGDILSGIEKAVGSNFADYIQGTFGNDTIEGGGGNDTIYGGEGNDFLVGGAGSDSFNFDSYSHGKDTIADFKVGVDHLNIDGMMANNYTDLMAHASQVGNNLVFDLYGDTITLNNVQKANFTEANVTIKQAVGDAFFDAIPMTQDEMVYIPAFETPGPMYIAMP